MQVAPFQRPRTRRADRGIARRNVVHHHKLHFANGHLTDPYLPVRLRTPVPSLTPGSWFITGSNAVLHASLSSAFLPLRQIVIWSASIEADSRHRHHGGQEYTRAGARAWSETSAFGAFDPAAVLPHPKIGRGIEQIAEVARFSRLRINVGCA
jgi:hypothetical protein